MAWIRRDSIGQDYYTEAHSSDEMKNWFRQNVEYLKNNFNGLEPLRPSYLNSVDSVAGFRMLPPAAKLEVKIVSMPDTLPDAVTGAGVSTKIKEKIEELEPGVHQFFPIEITLPDSSIDSTRWYMNVSNRVDAISIEHCEDVYEYRSRPEQYPDWFYYRSNEGRNMKLAVRKKIVAGMAIWYDWRFKYFFFSEELGQYFLDNGIRGYRLRPEEDLMRSNHVIEV